MNLAEGVSSTGSATHVEETIPSVVESQVRLRDDMRHHVNRYVDGKLPTQREQRRSYRRVPFFDVKLSLSMFI